MAPTVSLWDCGEFISTSVIMGVPHPPGTPLYLIISNFFSQIPIFNDIGARVNLASPIASALSVMFLYMIIVYLIEEFDNNKKSLIKNYAAFIGAMTFSVTDAHWFNSVESEVYSLSTFFTAIVVWLILKWSQNFKNKSNIKYLILIAYCLGLAIGIHLLNLLAIPFIGLIIFFKYKSESENKKISFYNICILTIGTGLFFIIIYLGIIKGLPSIANTLGGYGLIIIFIVITFLSALILNLSLKKFTLIQKIAAYSFSCMILFLTVNQIYIKDYKQMQLNHRNNMNDYSRFIGDCKINQIEEKMDAAQTQSREAYTFHYMDLIKSYIKLEIAGSFIDEANHKITAYEQVDKNGLFVDNSRINYLSLIKKQNGWDVFQAIFIIMLIMSIIIFYDTQKKDSTSNFLNVARIFITATLMIIVGYSTYSLIFIRAPQNPKINYNNPNDIESIYKYINRDQYGSWSILDREHSLRVNSQQNDGSWMRYTQDRCNPSTAEINNFVWDYQFKEMYFRYFAWQFIGKEKWEDKSWERNSLNNQDLDMYGLSDLQGVSWLRYGLPLAFLIGLIGLIYQSIKDWRRWVSVNTLFILTGIAIVIYLNQSDPQPRERDYAYVGSFFAFSIWIGIGCYACISTAAKYIYTKYIPTISAIILFIMMPLLMGIIDYHEHDRSKRFEAWDYAYNLLNSCDPNAILFTNGDNDTFPLWYIQEVEKIRTDVKVINLSLLNFPDYIHQLDQHDPSLNIFKNESSKYLEIVQSENNDKLMDYAAQRWVYWDADLVDTDNDGEPDYDDGKNRIKINTDGGANFDWAFKGGTYSFGLTNFTIMHIIENCFDKQPIYFSTTTGTNNLGLHDYLIQEGLVYRLTEKEDFYKDNNELIKILVELGLIRESEINLNIDKTISMITKAKGEPLHNNEFIDLNQNGIWDKELIIRTKEDYLEYQGWLNKFPEIGLYRYTNLDQPGIYYGSNIERLISNYKNVFFKTSKHILLNEKYEYLKNSFDLLNLLNIYYPDTVIPKEFSYDVEALQYCQLLSTFINYKQINKEDDDDDTEKIMNQIKLILQTVNPKLVEQYFPKLYPIIFPEEIFGNVQEEQINKYANLEINTTIE